MKIKNILQAAVTIVMVTAFATASAQSLSTKDQRLIKQSALNTMYNYERWSQWVNDHNDDTYYERFLDLFTTSKAVVYNDLMGLSTANEVSAKEYVDLLYDKTQQNSVFVQLKNLKTGTPVSKNGSWTITVEYDKAIVYINNCNVRLNSNDYYGADYHETATLVWNQSKDECLIQSITGSIASDRERLTPDFIVIRHMSTLDDGLRIDGHKPAFDEVGMSIYPSQVSISYPDPDVNAVLRQEDGQCQIYYVDYVPKRFRVRPWANIGVGNVYTITTNTNTTLQSASSSGMGFGIDFGYGFPIRSKLKVSLYTGVGMYTSKLTSAYSFGSFSYTTNQDIDGDTYVRQYSDVNVEQKHSFSDFVVPFYFELEYPVAKSVGIWADAGARLHFGMSTKSDDLTGSYKVKGFYAQYDDLTFDETSGINGFTNSGVLREINNIPLERKGFVPDVFGRIGLRVKVWNTLSIDAGAGYSMSVGDCFSSQVTAADMHPLVYEVATGTETFHAPDAITKISRRSLDVFVGLTYKF